MGKLYFYQHTSAFRFCAHSALLERITRAFIGPISSSVASCALLGAVTAHNARLRRDGGTIMLIVSMRSTISLNGCPTPQLLLPDYYQTTTSWLLINYSNMTPTPQLIFPRLLLPDSYSSTPTPWRFLPDSYSPTPTRRLLLPDSYSPTPTRRLLTHLIKMRQIRDFSKPHYSTFWLAEPY